MTNRERVHQAIDEMSDEEAERLLEIYNERRAANEDQGPAFRYAFAEIYRARDLAREPSPGPD
jgi:hypothetical protein